ncbi:MAG: TonB-dependent receptor [Gammaproteobacteria bacterium]|nr:TonB-dependent receptor [Gammaproteobacteria bacterium]
MSKTKRYFIGLLGALALLGARPAAVQAQNQGPSQDPAQRQVSAARKDPPPAPLQEIEITGTRIREPNMTSQSPITAVSSVEIQQEGATNISSVVDSLPQVHTAQSDTTSNNSTGVANLNLRGLGPTRTLVLIDGRRLGPGDPQGPQGEAADINFIPAALVSGVDVLTGGASAAYGSDAIAGVVNFHLMRNFQGVKITQTLNAAQHTQGGPWNAMLASAPFSTPVAIPGDQFGGLISDTAIVLGSNLDDGRGNVTMYIDYHRANPILDGSRNFLGCETALNKAGDGLLCHGSSDGEYGPFQSNSGKTLGLNPDGSASLVKFDKNGMAFNTAPTNYLQRSDERKSLGALGHFRLSQWADVYAEGMFMDDSTRAQVAAGGLVSGQGPTGLLQVPCNNQFLSAQEEPLICQDAAGNPLPVYQANGQPNVATILMPSLRLPQDVRADNLRHTDYRAVLGMRGAIGQSDWTYDASGTYWESLLSENFQNDVSFSKLEESLFGCPAGSNAGCVPINLFQFHGITPAMLDYIRTPGTKTGSSTESTLDANVSGDFGAWGGRSPWAADPIAASFGISSRRDSLNFLPDYEMQSNDLIGQGQVFPPVSGSESVTEEYAEVHIPVIEGKPLAKALNLDIAGRHSSYSISGSHPGFTTNTFKIGADYAPTSDIRFRGSFNRATRAPNIYELFFPQSLNTDSGYQDPCSGATPTASLAACEKTGVTQAQYGTILECRSSDCGGLFGGNPALRPETASTLTFGFVLTPRFAPNLELSVDYWAVRVDNFITNLPGAQIVNGCLLQGIDNLCPLIHRGLGGIIFGSTGWVTETDQNIGFLRNRGIDVDLNYREDLDNLGLHHLGTLAFNLTGTYLLEQTIDTTITRYDCAGLYGATCSAGDVNGPDFTWRHQARLTWITPWRVDASIRWRYLSSVSLDSNSSQPSLHSGKFDAYDAVIPAINYLDLSLSWQGWKDITLRAGVNNLLDTDPPLLNHKVVYRVNGGGNQDVYSVYDVLGRELFLSVSARF